MKGNGRIIAFLAVVVLIVVFVLLNMTVFTVSTVSVQDEVFSDYIDKTAIIDSAGIKLDSNIFIMSETNAKNNIETAFPYLSVNNIERRFPNKVVIHVGMRETAMSFAIEHTGRFALVDTDLKVLSIVDSSSAEYRAATHIESVTVSDVSEGITLDSESTVSKCLLQIISVSLNEELQFWHFFKTISFENTSVYITLLTGVCIRLDDIAERSELDAESESSIQSCIRMALALYKALDEQSIERRSGYIFFDNTAGWIWNAHDAFVTDAKAHISNIQ